MIKKIFNTFNLFSFVKLSIISLLVIASVAYAAPLYTPGQTLTPNCLPSNSDCTVQLYGSSDVATAEGCKTASSLGFKLDDSDESTLMQSTISAFSAAGGGCIYVDDGKTLRVDSQITFPNSGYPYYRQVPIRITSGLQQANYSDATNIQGIPPGGGRLDLRYHGSTQYGGGPKILTLGSGTLGIDHITVMTGYGASDCAAFLMTTQTTLIVNNVTFEGSNVGSSACNDGIILGGVGGLGTLSGTIADRFGGYGSQIDHNFFSKMRRLVVAQNVVNSVQIDHNTNDITCGNASGVGAAYYNIGGGASDVVATLPATCNPATQLPLHLTTTSGTTTGIYACTSTDTWTKQTSSWVNSGNTFSDNLVEVQNYLLAFVSVESTNNKFLYNDLWDGSATNYCMDSTSGHDTIRTAGSLPTFCNQTPGTYTGTSTIESDERTDQPGAIHAGSLVMGGVTIGDQSATYNWNWPASAGTSGYALLSGGGGSSPMTWGNVLSTVPTPSASTLGGVESEDCSAIGHVQKINTDGSVTCSADSGGGGSGGSNILDIQGAQVQETGDGTDHVVYTTTVSGGIPAGKCIRATVSWSEDSVGGSIYPYFRFGSGAYIGAGQARLETGTRVSTALICNNPGVQNSQVLLNVAHTDTTSSLELPTGVQTGSENAATDIVVKFTLNMTSPYTYTPKFWLVEKLY